MKLPKALSLLLILSGVLVVSGILYAFFPREIERIPLFRVLLYRECQYREGKLDKKAADFLNKANYCETETDCVIFYFGCERGSFANKNMVNSNEAKNLTAEGFFLVSRCFGGCPMLTKVLVVPPGRYTACLENKCVYQTRICEANKPYDDWKYCSCPSGTHSSKVKNNEKTNFVCVEG